MEKSVILDKLTQVFRETFDDEDIVADVSLSANDVAAWDSLSHIRMILSLEEIFEISLTPNEVNDLKNAGGLHPSDKTARPQILEREANPDYYDIVMEFERLTGVGGLINTSFNLHGEPIVCTAEDALHTFARTSLDAVVVGNSIVQRMGVQASG